MSPREPVAKLPLLVRKNVRDKLDEKVPVLRERMAKIGFPDFAFVANINVIYAYCEIDYAKENTGACIHEYFDCFTTSVENFTKQGADTEAVETMKKVASKNMVNLVPDEENRFNYNGCGIKDGQIMIYFHPERLGYNISDAATELPKAVDVALDALGGDELPIVIRRGIVTYLEEKGANDKAKLEKLFQKPIALEADIAKNYAFLKAHLADMSYPEYLDRLPEFIFYYFQGAVSKLEYKEFGKDDMLREAFNEAVDKGVIRFEIVEKLQHGNYCDCVFEDGELKLQTTVKTFAVNTDAACDEVLYRL